MQHGPDMEPIASQRWTYEALHDAWSIPHVRCHQGAANHPIQTGPDEEKAAWQHVVEMLCVRFPALKSTSDQQNQK